MGILGFVMGVLTLFLTVGLLSMAKKSVRNHRLTNGKFMFYTVLLFIIGILCIFSEMGGGFFFRGLLSGGVWYLISNISERLNRRERFLFVDAKEFSVSLRIASAVALLFFLARFKHWLLIAVLALGSCFVVQCLYFGLKSGELQEKFDCWKNKFSGK